MNTKILTILFIILYTQYALSGQKETKGSRPLPTKQQVIDNMKLVNDYFISGKPSPGDNKWVRSVYFTGCMEFYKVYPHKAYLDYMNRWAENNQWMLSTVTDHDADNQVCGQTYIDLYNMDEVKQEYKLEALKARMDNLVNDPSSANDDWFWVDAFYMAMPVFSRLGVLYHDPRYFDRMYSMYRNTKERRRLYDTEEHLWYRDGPRMYPNFKTQNGKKCFWSRGNGWVLAAYAHVLRDLPEDNQYREEFIQTFKEMSEALIKCQRSDGFWNVSLADPDDYGGPETSGTALFVYGMAWGINNGLLDRETYLPVVFAAWNAMVDLAVHPDGFLGYVQGPGYIPASSQPVTEKTTADFGVGAFLLAGSQIVQLAQGEMPLPAEELTDITVTASAYEQGTENTPEKTLDRDFATRWSAEGTQYITYDLQKQRTISSVDIAFYVGNTRKTYFSIALSADGKTFAQVFDGESGGTTSHWENFPFEARQARYVKITGRGNTKNKWNSVSEVRINGAASSTADIRTGYFFIHPNPLHGSIITIHPARELTGNIQVDITGLTGTRYLSEIQTIHDNEIKLSNLRLASGTYIVSLNCENRQYSERLIVK